MFLSWLVIYRLTLTSHSAVALKELCAFLKQLVPLREAGKEAKTEMQELRYPALEVR